MIMHIVAIISIATICFQSHHACGTVISSKQLLVVMPPQQPTSSTTSDGCKRAFAACLKRIQQESMK
jgi:hypothetical protein